MDEWVHVTNKLLDNGAEIMLFDKFLFKQPKRKSGLRDALKIACVVLYYGIKLLV